MSPRRLFVVPCLALACLAAAPPPRGLLEMTARRNALEKEMRKLEYRNPGAAAAVGEKWLAVRQELGEDLDYAHDRLAYLYGKAGDRGKRLTHLERRLALRVAKWGKGHYEVADAQLDVEDEKREQRLTPEGRQADLRASRLWGQLDRLLRENRRAESLAAAEKALAAARAAYGAKGRHYADVVGTAANAFQLAGRYARAEPLYREVVAVRLAVYGENHPSIAMALNNLGLLHLHQGAYAAAEGEMRRALEVMRRLRPPGGFGTGWHPMKARYATTVHNLALLYHSTGQYDRAEPIYREALAAYADAVSPIHYSYATCLDNLGGLYHAMGDLAAAAGKLEQSLKIRKYWLDHEFLVSMAGGNVHSDLALTLNNLAMVYKDAGQADRALPMLREVLALRRKLDGEAHAETALAMNNLANLLARKDQADEALRLQRKAAEVWKRTLGDKHVLYGNGLHNLATLYAARGELGKAREEFDKAHEVYRAAVGEEHPNYARSLGESARLHWRAGAFKEAWREAVRATAITRRHLERTASAQSERQQLLMSQMLRPALDRELALAAEAGRPAGDVYDDVLAWKGSVSARQLFTRRMRHALRGREDTEAGRLFARLAQAARELSTLSSAASGGRVAEGERRMRALSDRIEETEKELARASADFRGILEQRRLNRAALEKLLPADAALVDLLEYQHERPPARKGAPWTVEKRLAAFVVRPGQEVRRVDLGPAAAVAYRVEAWRRVFTRPGLAAGEGVDEAAALRKLLWAPLAGHIRGARLVLISPDGAAARLPWAALPGARPGSYLLEETALAVLPAPQLLGVTLEPRPADAGDGLLVVGDVDYAAAAGAASTATRSAARSGGAATWPALASTAAEVAAVRRAYRAQFPGGAVTPLERDTPTEEAVRRQAPRNRYLHFATHGYFARATVRSALAAPRGPADAAADPVGFHPGLLSGLVLAGANRPADPGHDDGVLTALEVAELDLRQTDLAVLSACETALGSSAGGEGVLGLQRAFQTAGARSVVASLWKVPDRATQELMGRFYDNLWAKKMTRLEALRQAQLWMLREGARAGALRGVFNPKTGTGKGAARSTDRAGRPLPHYWAAFVLSGAWR
jgi:CHAT domain-containing protein/tetratricopeptide (TPR) repeat protein